MRIFWHSGKENEQLVLLHQTSPRKNLVFPIEIIRKIVEYLPRSCLPLVANISRAWYASSMPVLYRHIYIRTFRHWMLLQRSFEDEAFGQSFGGHVASLVLQPSPQLVSSQVASALSVKAIRNDDKLEPNTRGYVRLVRVDYDLTGLEDIGKNEVERQVDTSKKEAEWLSFVTNDQVDCVLKFCHNLEYLYLSGCENLSGNVLIPVYEGKLRQRSQRVAKLKGLWLNLVRNIAADTLINMTDVDRTLGKSELKYLDLSFVISLKDNVIEHMLSHFGPSLVQLQFNSAYELTNAAAVSISKYCPNIELLYLTGCWRVDNEGMIVLSRNCKKLENLSASFLSNVNEDGLDGFARHSTLISLNITGCGINAMFKHLVLRSWTDYRIEHRMVPLTIVDRNLNMI